MLISDKIKTVRTLLGLSQDKFGEGIGLTRSSMAQIETGKQKAPVESILEIVKIYNIPYAYFFEDDLALISEVNDKLKNKSLTKNRKYHESTRESSIVDDTNFHYIPLIPVEAIAGLSKGDVQVMEYDVTSHYKIPEFNGKADFLIRVCGTSMAPKYYNGDILACKRIEELTFIQWGKVYVMDTIQGPLVKRLYSCPGKDDCIICHSDNMDMYPRFQITKNDIRSISIVIGTIRLE